MSALARTRETAELADRGTTRQSSRERERKGEDAPPNAAKLNRAIGVPRSSALHTSAMVPPTRATAVEPAHPLMKRATSMVAMLGARACGIKKRAKTMADPR